MLLGGGLLGGPFASFLSFEFSCLKAFLSGRGLLAFSFDGGLAARAKPGFLIFVVVLSWRHLKCELMLLAKRFEALDVEGSRAIIAAN